MAKTEITTNDFDRALLLVPIVLELGIEGARRFVSAKTLTEDELIERSKHFQENTAQRNAAFAEKLKS